MHWNEMSRLICELKIAVRLRLWSLWHTDATHITRVKSERVVSYWAVQSVGYGIVILRDLWFQNRPQNEKDTWLFGDGRDNATNSFEFICFQLESTHTHARHGPFQCLSNGFVSCLIFHANKKHKLRNHIRTPSTFVNDLMVRRAKRASEREKNYNQWTTNCLWNSKMLDDNG